MSTTHLDRVEASKLLNVSTRTIDRYIRKYRFKTRKNGRKVLIKREDLGKIIKNHIGQYVSQEQINSILGKETEVKKADTKSNITVKDIQVEEVKQAPEKTTEAKSEMVYKSLYEELRKELKEKQERLDAATYRVGQLEAEIKNTVPMLDYTRKEKELKEAREVMEQRNLEYEQALQQSELKLRNERMIKWVYLSIVGALLVAEPILFLFWAFS